jgi:Zn-dependent peptidase ImmA (M78 family)
MHQSHVRARVAQLRSQFPVLYYPATYDRLAEVCEASNVRLVRCPLPAPAPAQLVCAFGERVLLVDSNASERSATFLVAHELGHLFLHHEPLADVGGARVYLYRDAALDAVLEEDANTFAALLMAGFGVM